MTRLIFGRALIHCLRPNPKRQDAFRHIPFIRPGPAKFLLHFSLYDTPRGLDLDIVSNRIVPPALS